MSKEQKLDTSKDLYELVEEGWTADDLLDAYCEILGIKRKNESISLTKLVAKTIHEIGIPAHVLGYRYVCRAIELAVKDQRLTTKMSAELYPMVADEFGSTGARVERTIRSAIELAWERGDEETMKKYFGNTVSITKGKPTNREFITMLVEKIYLDGGWTEE